MFGKPAESGSRLRFGPIAGSLLVLCGPDGTSIDLSSWEVSPHISAIHDGHPGSYTYVGDLSGCWTASPL